LVCSYLLDGIKQHNMARVYAGIYKYHQRTVPIIVVVKCGTELERISKDPAELALKKPGNRGKRDSQMILLNFLSTVTFNDRMSQLEYDIFYKIQEITNGSTADQYDLILMVDADTSVSIDSLSVMVQTMKNNPTVMGLCGETRIANKTQSWFILLIKG
jgi:chitin synthase